MKHVLILFLIWIVVFGTCYAAFYFVADVERFDALANFGTATYGTVAGKQPKNHASIIYYFTVDGIQYTGQGGAGDGNPEFNELKIGDRVVVYYDNDYPLNSFSGYPQYQAQRNRQLQNVASIATSIFLLVPLAAIYFAIKQARKTGETG